MQLKAPKSKANSVDRPDFGGFGETEQAGFGHVPSGRMTARDISREAAKDPAAMEQLREALETSKKRSSPGTCPASRSPGRRPWASPPP